MLKTKSQLKANSGKLAINGGSQALANGTGGAGLNAIAVSAGDLLYLILHPRGSHICDTTSVNLSINVISPHTTTPTQTPTATLTTALLNGSTRHVIFKM